MGGRQSSSGRETELKREDDKIRVEGREEGGQQKMKANCVYVCVSGFCVMVYQRMCVCVCASAVCQVDPFGATYVCSH